ncbi:MAG: sigma-E processing peptidase SpoIIGA [Lachnospiraceae bacterium]|nr:sigma-E processing peptidase SpoIIGA [Lachnospiraceae bacterium]
MTVRLYLDSIFLMQLFLNCVVLSVVRMQLGISVSRKRIWLTAAGMSGLDTCFFLLPFSLLWLEVTATVLNALGLCFLFLPLRYRRHWRRLLLYGLADTLVASGILRIVMSWWYALTGGMPGLWAFLMCALILYETAVWGIGRYKKSRGRHIYPVTILSAGQKRQVQALYDTGNGLTEPVSRRPVCLVEEELLAGLTLENPLFFRAIPFHTLGCDEGLLYGIEIPELLIDAEDGVHSVKEVICAGVSKPLSPGGKYQMILHPGLF